MKLQIVDGQFGKEMRECPDDTEDSIYVREIAGSIAGLNPVDQAAFISQLFNQVSFHPRPEPYLRHPAVLENLTRFIYEIYTQTVGYDGRNSFLTIEISRLCHKAERGDVSRYPRGNNATYVMVD